LVLKLEHQIEDFHKQLIATCQPGMRPTPKDLEIEGLIHQINLIMEEVQATDKEIQQLNDELSTSRLTFENDQRRYHHLLNYAPVGYLVTDANAIIQEANLAAVQLIDIERHILMGVPLALLIPHQARSDFQEKIARFIHSDQINGTQPIHRWETRIEPPGREGFMARLDVVLDLNQEGQVYTFHWWLRKIDDHDQADNKRERLFEEKQSQRRLLEAIFESVPNCMALLSGPDLTFQFANSSYRLITPHSDVDILGQKFIEIWPPEEGYVIHNILDQVLKSGEQVAIRRYTHESQDGSFHYYSFHASQLLSTGQPSILIMMIETTELEEARLQAERAATEAERRSEELNTVLTSMTEGILIFDTEGNLVQANPASEKVVGQDPVQLEKSSLFKRLKIRYMDGQFVQVEKLPSSRALKGEIVQAERYLLANAEKEDLVILVSAYPLFLNNKLTGAVVVWTDITEQETLMNQLEAERLRLSAIITNAPVAIVVINKRGRVILSNPIADHDYRRLSLNIDDTDHTGVKICKPNGETFDPSDFPLSRSVFHAETHINQEIILEWPNHKRQFLLANTSPIFDKQGIINGAIGVYQDITSQKLTEFALRESEERFKVALQGSPVMVYTADRNLRYTWVYYPGNREVATSMIGKRDDELFPTEEAREMLQIKQEVIESGFGNRQEIRLNIGADEKIYDLSIEPLRTDSGAVIGITAAAVDITDRRQMEAEILKNQAHLEVQRRLTEQREQERLQIARDLHDGPVQELYGVILALDEASSNIQDEPTRKTIEQTIDTVQQQIQELRAYMVELRPPTLFRFGLEKAIESHIETFASKHPDINIHFKATTEDRQLSDEVQLAIYRIYQELINNIVKHAGASEVEVQLRLEGHWIELQVEDNGAGFHIPQNWVDLVRDGHLGLVGIQERAEAIGGKLKIYSKPGKGTAVRLRVPTIRPPHPLRKGINI
jgi:PAS domain S-box-containing protein